MPFHGGFSDFVNTGMIRTAALYGVGIVLPVLIVPVFGYSKDMAKDIDGKDLPTVGDERSHSRRFCTKKRRRRNICFPLKIPIPVGTVR